MNELIKREFNGIQVAFEGKEKISLTDLWKAAGSPTNQEVWRWLNDSPTADFVLAVMRKEKPNSVGGLKTKPHGRSKIKDLSEWVKDVFKCASVGGFIKTVRGRNGGTWAHWQIALAYAKYLSPELHMFVNQCFKDHMEEASNPDLKMERAINAYRRKGKDDKWIDARFRTKLTNQYRNGILASRQGGPGNIYAMCSTETNKAIIGKTSHEFKAERNLPKSASVRDHLSSIELLQIALTEEVSAERIKENNVFGNSACANVHSVIGSRIHSAVSMRGI